MAKIISSQRHIDPAIVEEKRGMRDYGVLLSPEFELQGETYCVVLDGHHSLAAAKADGARPLFAEASVQDNDRVALLKRGEIEDFLVGGRIDSDYYDIETGLDVW